MLLVDMWESETSSSLGGPVVEEWKARGIARSIRSQDGFLPWPEEHMAFGLLMDGISLRGDREEKYIQGERGPGEQASGDVEGAPVLTSVAVMSRD